MYKNYIEDYTGIRSNLPQLYTGWENKHIPKEYKQVKTSVEELKEMKNKVG